MTIQKRLSPDPPLSQHFQAIGAAPGRKSKPGELCPCGLPAFRVSDKLGLGWCGLSTAEAMGMKPLWCPFCGEFNNHGSAICSSYTLRPYEPLDAAVFAATGFELAATR
jgi:hypothetical protein